MRFMVKKALAAVLAGVLALSVLGAGKDKVLADEGYGEGTRGFVERGYDLMLDRRSDEEGLEFWTDQLNTKQINAAEMINWFMDSPEYKAKNLSDADAIEIFYNVMLARKSDEGGKNFWLGQLKTGISYRHIIDDFAYSDEFHGICESYGIEPGLVAFVEPRDMYPNISWLVCKCYRNILQREPDIPGLNDWVSKVASGEMYPEDLISGFLYSPEAMSGINSDDEFIEALYRAFFGHGSDPEGKQNWLNYMASGKTRAELFFQFTQSQEFDNLVASHNLTKKPTPTPSPSPSPTPTIAIVQGDKLVALTFDDGPYAPVTNRILDQLEKVGGHATFFLVGDRVGTYSSCVTRERDLGCELANHTYDHKHSLSSVSGDTIVWEVSACNDAVREVAGISPTIMRPCGGSYNDTTKANVGMPMIIWSLDTADWKYRDATRTANAILNNVSDGDIILMHDLYESTATAMETVIPELVARGYKLVTVSELAAAKGINLEAGEPYYSLR